jgi:hypothetical protein
VGDGWAWLSLSAVSSHLSSEETRDLLPGSVASQRNPHLASVRFRGGDAGSSLSALLSELADYIDSHRDALRNGSRSADFQLRVGWSPRSPQESVAIPAPLLAALGDLGADVMIDVYDDADETAEPPPAG